MRTLSCLIVLALIAFTAQAAVLEDFEGSYEGPGSLVADPEDSLNTCLYLTLIEGYSAEVYELDISDLSNDGSGTVTMDIFDMGKYLDGTSYGPRWGVEGALNSIAAGIIEKTWLGCEAGYGLNSSEYDNQSTTGIRTGDWFSAGYLGGPRQVDTLDSDATAEIVGADGAWQTWSFTVDTDGYVTEIKMGDNVRYNRDSGLVGVIPGLVGSLEDIWISAGKNGTSGLDSVYIDNITFEGAAVELHPGDADGNGIVNLDDFIILKQNYGQSPTTWAQGNFNDDDVVNLDDFIILKQNYGWVGD